MALAVYFLCAFTLLKCNNEKGLLKNASERNNITEKRYQGILCKLHEQGVS